MVACAEMFVAKLNAENLKFSVRDLDDGGCCVSIGFGGKITNIFFDGDDDGSHVALRTVFEKCPADRVPDLLVVCNALNCKYRWLKFYIDSDNDIMVSDDAIVSAETAGAECYELLLRTVSILDDVKPMVMRAIYA